MKIIAELLAGIDPTTTDLITNPNEYWLPDENNICTLTHYDGSISGNYWKMNGNILELNDIGTDSVCWEKTAGNILALKA